MAQLPGEPQEIPAAYGRRGRSAASPGSARATPHLPCDSTATNTFEPRTPANPRAYPPTAAQLPAAAHDIAATSAFPCASSASMPGTRCARCQVPRTSSATKATSRAERSSYAPPTTQLPAEAHDNDTMG